MEATGVKLKLFRVTAIALPQALVLLDLVARFDLLFGLNRTDCGFTSLLFLFVLAPLVDLSWLLDEIIAAIRMSKRHHRAMSFVMPGLALAVLLESVVADIFLLSQAKM
jgi:hypothetical protein